MDNYSESVNGASNTYKVTAKAHSTMFPKKMHSTLFRRLSISY